MSNWIDVHLDVLASCPKEINRIERALQEPCDELIAWRAQPRLNIVAFPPVGIGLWNLEG